MCELTGRVVDGLAWCLGWWVSGPGAWVHWEEPESTEASLALGWASSLNLQEPACDWARPRAWDSEGWVMGAGLALVSVEKLGAHFILLPPCRGYLSSCCAARAWGKGMKAM